MLPVDGIVAGYNLLLALVWGGLAATVWFAPWLGVAHLAGASLYLVLRRRPRLSRATAALREIYPLLWLVGFWFELDYLLPLLHPAFFDAQIVRLDVALFGASWGTEWLLRAPSPWLSEPMYLLYMLWAPLVIVPPLALALAGGRRRDTLRDLVFRMTLTYLACCLVYLLVPVDGPQPVVPAGSPLARGLFHGLMGRYYLVRDSGGTALPSFHVVAVVTLAWLAWRWRGPRVAMAVSLVALGVSVSTVYTQHHYVVDAVAGLALALALQALAPALQRRLSEGSLP
jgi:hypothetical protein